jgi:hypothetical protein
MAVWGLFWNVLEDKHRNRCWSTFSCIGQSVPLESHRGVADRLTGQTARRHSMVRTTSECGGVSPADQRLICCRSHTSCISEAEKYQGALYKGVGLIPAVLVRVLGVVSSVSGLAVSLDWFSNTEILKEDIPFYPCNRTRTAGISPTRRPSLNHKTRPQTPLAP